MQDEQRLRQLDEMFRKIATAFDHAHPEQNDYYRWAKEKLQNGSEDRLAFVEYVREQAEVI